MSTSGRRLVVAIVVSLALVATAAGCGKSGSGGTTSGTLADEGTPVDGGSLVWGVNSETPGWNPHDSRWAQPGALVGSSVLEPLLTTGPDLQAQPWLATSFTPNAAYDEWTLVLRSGVVFQDGEPFNAASVKLNLDDASTAGLSGAAIRGLFRQVTVVDDLTVRVELTQPWAAFPDSFLTGQSAMQMAPDMINSGGRGQTHPIGTGPYTFQSWQPDSEFRTTKNSAYWRPGEPHLDALTFRVIPDSASSAAALQAGDVNLIFTSSALAANQLASSFTVIKNWDTEPGMAMTNTNPVVGGKPNPMANRHARRALAFATDRATVAGAAGDGVQSGTSPFPPSSPWGMPADQNGYVGFDVDQAKQEVEAYKAETGADSLAITLAGTPDADMVRLLQRLQGEWQDAGIKVTIETKEATSFITDVVGGNYEVAMFSIYSSPDPDQNHYFWSAATAPGAGGININFTQYTTPQMEADLKIGRENPDQAARKTAYDDLVRQINDAAVNIWTFATPYSIIAQPAVRGLKPATEVPFGNFQPKTWLGGLWLAK
ncbi:MAG TPA: ABC transporter substrate-binding protein [Acidimicrobiales bacterium]